MKVGFIGDIILSPDMVIDPVILERLLSTKLNIANLEGPFIQPAFKPHSKGGGLYQLSKNEKQLHQLNIQAVSLANNHIFDFGLEGFNHTIEVLRNGGIKFFGAGSNLVDASAIQEIDVSGQKIGLGGYISEYLYPFIAKVNTPGVAPLRYHEIKKALLHSDAPVKIIFNHWNQEFENYPDPMNHSLSTRILAHCDCIVGSHPHNIQGIGEAGEKLIFNSIGNFTIPHTHYGDKYLREYPDHAYQSYFLILEIEQSGIIDHEVVPYRISSDGKSILAMSDTEKEIFFKKIKFISTPLALPYNQYYRFFQHHKIRKFRPTMVRSHFRNKVLLYLNSTIRQLLNLISRFFAWFFNLLGIRKFVRNKLAFILNRFFKA